MPIPDEEMRALADKIGAESTSHGQWVELTKAIAYVAIKAVVGVLEDNGFTVTNQKPLVYCIVCSRALDHLAAKRHPI